MTFTLASVWPDGSQIITDKLLILVATNDFSVQVSTLFKYELPTPTRTLTATATETAIVPSETHTATATDAVPTETLTATPTSTSVASAHISLNSGGANTQVTVSGVGFPANTTVNVHLGRFDGEGSSDDLLRYATATTDNQGNYSAAFVMPTSFPSGDLVPTGKLLVIVATENFSVQDSTIFDYIQSDVQQQNLVEPARSGAQTTTPPATQVVHPTEIPMPELSLPTNTPGPTPT